MVSETELILRPSPGRTKIYMWGSIVFTVLALFTAQILGVLLFGLASLVFYVQRRPGASYLRLHPAGFDVCSLYRKWPTILWKDTSEFRVAYLLPHGNKMVMFDSKSLPKGIAVTALKWLNKATTGNACGLPNNYGLNHQELADLMNKWRAAATS